MQVFLTFVDERYLYLLFDVAPGSEITPCIKIVIPLVVYRVLGNVICMK